ncbi:tubulin gamma chain (TBG) [Vairimorpha necatrix]|uniref:Tubulin gamma chain n=1 Tax=Vairimorpha necatrix TaxID=6039 RepID=A0AAX4JDS8_9MICR
MREIITLQIGQCGNQMATEFWKTILNEHNINSEGSLISNTDLNDRKDIFFYESDDNKFIPRSILIDLEPRVLSQLSPLFNRENIFMPNEGGGAGNNWAHGFFVGQKHKEEALEIVRREAEGCDALEGFFMCHSIAGGTGSGFGSMIMQELKDEYPKNYTQTYSIFPNNEESSDVVVQPYNSILTLQRLYEFSDSVIVMDNTALGKLTLDSLRIDTPTFQHINSLISTIISASTSTMRFPGYTFADYPSLYSSLIPFKNLKFLVPSYTPFTIETLSKIVRKTSCGDVMRRLLSSKTRLATFESYKSTSAISVLNILYGVEDTTEIHKSVMKIMDRKLINFVPSMEPIFNIALSKQPSVLSKVSGLGLINSTGISHLFNKIIGQFDKLRKQKAFMDIYKKYGIEVENFDECRENLVKISEEYSATELVNFNRPEM